MSIALRLIACTCALIVSACASTPRPVPAGPKAMVTAANPLAVKAGYDVLRRGGTAVDAAVAVQAVLGLVEPQSSGLGGGAFLVLYEGKTGKTIAYNGRETAPAAASPAMFMGEDGKPLSYAQAVLSGRSTGVLGAVPTLAMAHRQYGKLPWNSLFGDAERLAEDGFVVSPRLASLVRITRAPQNSAPDVVAYFTKTDGTLVGAGDVLKNPAYAATVRRLAAEGPSALMEGSIAEAIVARLAQGERPGVMTLADLRTYQPKVGPALCRPYRIYVVCVPPAPSGGPSLLEGLGLLERTAIAQHPNDTEGWYLFSQASRLMYADRDRYMADPDFVDVPTEGLLDPAYLDARVKLIGPVAGPPPKHGVPKGAGVRGEDRTLEPGGTSHMVIADPYGNVVSMTTTVESIFGSGRMVGGFFLNNQLTDFSYSPTEPDGVPAANAVAPGKRPRSAMAPAIVLDAKGEFAAALGSPGGPAILAYNLKTMTAVLDWKMPMQAAIDLPNLVARGANYGAEIDKFDPTVVTGLAEKDVKLGSGGGAEGSGVHGIEMTPQGLRGGADPRREGVVLSF